MNAMTATSSTSAPFTVADLDRMPDDGRRYELIDGTLLVSPAPSVRHQTIVAKLLVTLTLECPAGLEVLTGPLAVRDGVGTEVQPDVLVARVADFAPDGLPVAPLLAVEVLSPSTALIDLNIKKAVYERMGVPSYWIIDPHGPRLTVLELIGSGYTEVASVPGKETFSAVTPFSVQIVPDQLLGQLRAH